MPHVTHIRSKAPLQPHQLCALFIDSRCVQDGGHTFTDYQKNTQFTDAIGMPYNPLTIARILHTFQAITSNAYLGYFIDTKRKKILAGCGGGPASKKKGEEEEDEGDAAETTKGRNFVYHKGEQIPTVMQYVEPLFNEATKERLGWFIYYISYDFEFSFDLALINYCDIEQLKQQKSAARYQKAMAEEGEVRPFDSVHKWVETAVNDYTGGKFWDNKDTIKAMQRLTNASNPAQFHKVFSLERAIFWLAFQRLEKRYVNEYQSTLCAPADPDADLFADEAEEESSNEGEEPKGPSVTIRFPYRKAYELHASKKSKKFFSVPFDEFERDTEKIFDNEAQRMLYSKREREGLDQPSKALTAFQSMKETITKLRLGYEKEELEKGKEGYEFRAQARLMAWAEQRSTDLLIQAVLSSYEDCPATVKCYEYYTEKQRIEGTPNPVIVTPIRLVHESLTFLGNVMAHDALKAEYAVGVLHLHQELAMLLMISLMAFNICSTLGVVFHAFFSGPASSGKSQLLKWIGQALIKGTTENLSYQTKLAMTSDANTNGIILLADEAGSSFAPGKDQEKEDLMKEILTRGKVNIDQIFIDKDTGRRRQIKTEANKMVMVFGAMNPAFTSIFKAPMLSRICQGYVPIRERPDRQAFAETFARQDDPRMARIASDYMDQHRKRQMISSNLFTWMDLGLLPPINTAVPQALIPLAMNVLREAGYRCDDRVMFRLMIATQAACLSESNSRVFFTEDYFPKGTPFHFSHVLKVAPLLWCTREQFWYALGTTFFSIVNPFIDCVLETIWELIGEQSTKFPSDRTCGVDTYDYNYYLLDISRGHTLNKSEYICPSVAEMIMRRMRKSDRELLSVENIMDVLRWLEGRGAMDGYYNYRSADERWRRSRPVPMNILKVKTSGSQGYGMEFCREFMDGMIDPKKGHVRRERSFEGLLDKCLLATAPPLTKERASAPRKMFIKGLTDRLSFRPHYYKTFDPVEMAIKDEERKAVEEAARVQQKAIRDEKRAIDQMEREGKPLPSDPDALAAFKKAESARRRKERGEDREDAAWEARNKYRKTDKEEVLSFLKHRYNTEKAVLEEEPGDDFATPEAQEKIYNEYNPAGLALEAYVEQEFHRRIGHTKVAQNPTPPVFVQKYESYPPPYKRGQAEYRSRGADDDSDSEEEDAEETKENEAMVVPQSKRQKIEPSVVANLGKVTTFNV